MKGSDIYEYAMDKKWFATILCHAQQWGKLFYPDGICDIIEITLPARARDYMFHVNMLDNIGPAYAADVNLLNKIVRKVRII